MSTCILWFRKSLRLHDNAPLIAAAQDDGINSILPLYILDPEQVGKNFEKFGPNRLKFLIDSLRDLNDQLSSNYKSKLIILNDNPLEIFDCIQQNAKNSINSLFCEFSSEPWERKAFSDVSNLLKYKNPAFIVNTFSAVHTILDLEKTISLPGFRKPKSMKDMEKIFSANFETNNHGFFEINEPLMAPKTIHPLPDLTNLGLNGSNPKLSVLSVDEIADKISLKSGTNLRSVNSYFTGGETEALQRL